jgi:hypothetical protein
MNQLKVFQIGTVLPEIFFNFNFTNNVNFHDLKLESEIFIQSSTPSKYIAFQLSQFTNCGHQLFHQQFTDIQLL